jgi:hypothetical protein
MDLAGAEKNFAKQGKGEGRACRRSRMMSPFRNPFASVCAAILRFEIATK